MSQILVLEEDSAFYEQLKTCLEAKGHRTWRVASVEEGHQFLSRYEVALIISGLRLESADVFQFLRSVKSDDATKNIPFVFVSCNPDHVDRFATESIRRAGMSLGACKYILSTKFDANRFWESLEHCLPASASKRDALGSRVVSRPLHELGY